MPLVKVISCAAHSVIAVLLPEHAVFEELKTGCGIGDAANVKTRFVPLTVPLGVSESENVML